MKISVLMPSRGRARQCAAVVTAMDMLACDSSRVRYVVRADGDDPQLNLYGAMLGGLDRVTLLTGPRPLFLGSMFNECARAHEADIYTAMTDDTLPATLNWDDIIVNSVDDIRGKIEIPPVLAWRNSANDPSHPIIPHEWLAKSGGFFTADRFPYWFDDFWLSEVFEMVTGYHVPAAPIDIVGHKGKTQRMRDLPFWYKYFSATRQVRAEEARVLRCRLTGIDEPIEPGIINEIAAIDRFHQSKAAEWEAVFTAETGEPDATYLLAKAKAEAELVSLGVFA